MDLVLATQFLVLRPDVTLDDGVLERNQQICEEPTETNPVNLRYLELKDRLEDPFSPELEFWDKIKIYTWEWFEKPKSSAGAKYFAYWINYLARKEISKEKKRKIEKSINQD